MTERSAPEPGVGLCSVCRHVKRVKTGRGSVFYLCKKSEEDPRFAKYPPLPVMRCEGFAGEAGRSPLN